MYDQKENKNRNNYLQTNQTDIRKVLRSSNTYTLYSDDKKPLLSCKRQNFLEIFKKQSVVSRITQGEGFDQRSQDESNSNLNIDEHFLKFVKLPSIEYIVQDYQRKIVQNALFPEKVMKLSDFCENHTPLTSREEMTEKKLDVSKHQKTKVIAHQNNKDGRTHFIFNFNQPESQSPQQYSFHAQTKKYIQECNINGLLLEQREKIARLQQKNTKLQLLYKVMIQSAPINGIKTKIFGSDLQTLKNLIQRMKIFQ